MNVHNSLIPGSKHETNVVCAVCGVYFCARAPPPLSVAAVG